MGFRRDQFFAGLNQKEQEDSYQVFGLPPSPEVDEGYDDSRIVTSEVDEGYDDGRIVTPEVD